MRKITDLYETRWRTVHSRDAYGNLIKDSEEYEAKRIVRTIGQGPRFGHFFVDSIVFRIIVYGIGFLIGMTILRNENSSLLLESDRLLNMLFGGLFFCLTYSLYYFLFEYYTQKTPGKYLTKTIVIDEYGNKPELRQILFRSLIRLVPFETFSCFDDRGWHDEWSKTYVVPETELSELKRLIEEADKTEIENE